MAKHLQSENPGLILKKDLTSKKVLCLSDSKRTVVKITRAQHMKRGNTTERKILEAALDLIIRKGYHGTSIKDITSKIGMSKAAPYSHFKSKVELVLRLIQEYEKHFVDEIVKINEEGQGDAVDRFHRVLRFNGKAGVEHPDLLLFFIYISNELNGHPEFQPTLERVERKLEGAFKGIFQLGISQGLFRQDFDPDSLSKVFSACSRGLFRRWASRRDYKEGIELTKAFRILLLKGIEA
jgi:AcrR family transcriptional regulator